MTADTMGSCAGSQASRPEQYQNNSCMRFMDKRLSPFLMIFSAPTKESR
jgi:hypothetical protein